MAESSDTTFDGIRLASISKCKSLSIGWSRNSLNNPVPILWDFVAAWRSFSLKARRRERTIIANDDGARRRVSVEDRGEGYGDLVLTGYL
jgi:hypothetical protein